MVAFAFKNIYFHLFYQVHGMSGNADTPNLRQFPLIPFLLSSFPFLRLARHRQLQLVILRIAAHRHLLAEMSRIVRLVIREKRRTENPHRKYRIYTS